ncbi:MAG: hypothetical protein FJX75_19760 [Armatimonadetes bacterium]|nr:hypothetical protein [Armatimonadota bacterium]
MTPDEEEQWVEEVYAAITDLVNVLDALDIVEKAHSVRVPQCLIRPLERLLKTYLNGEERQLALVSYWFAFNYCVDPTLGPALADLIDPYVDPDTASAKQLMRRLGTLVVLGVPAGEEDAALQHCLLAHELGHVIEAADILGVSASMKGLPEQWSHWIREIQCDMLASHMLGPSYLFAFIHRLWRIEAGDSHPFGSMRIWACLRALDYGASHESDNPLRRLAAKDIVGKEAVWSQVAADLGDDAVATAFAKLVDHLYDRMASTALPLPWGWRDAQFAEPRTLANPAVERLLHHVPPAMCFARGDDGTLVPTIIDPRDMWLAAWLVELQPTLRERFAEPWAEEKDGEAIAARKLDLLVAKGIEAADTQLAAEEG